MRKISNNILLLVICFIFVLAISGCSVFCKHEWEDVYETKSTTVLKDVWVIDEPGHSTYETIKYYECTCGQKWYAVDEKYSQHIVGLEYEDRLTEQYETISVWHDEVGHMEQQEVIEEEQVLVGKKCVKCSKTSSIK